MISKKNSILGLAVAFTLVACDKDEKTKTVTVENPRTVEELNATKKERDELKAQLALAGKTPAEIEALKADLEKAQTKVDELTKAVAEKETEIAQLKKDAVSAQDQAAKIKALEDEKAVLVASLAEAKSAQTQLSALVSAAQADEVLYKKVLDYAVAHGAKDRAAIGAALDADLAAIETSLSDLAAQEIGLQSAITTQAQAVVSAAANFDNVSKNLLGVYAELSARVEKGETLSVDDDATFKTLKTYIDAATAQTAEKKTKASIETAIDGLSKEIAALDATLAKAGTELKAYNDELLALALTDKKLESPRAKELTALIVARTETIAATTSGKETKAAALGEQNTKLQASKDQLAALAKTQETALTAYNDSAVSAAADSLNAAEAELERRVTAYQNYLKAVTTAQASKVDLAALKAFFDSKLKEVKG